jgi:hypothetical protein
MPTAKTIPVGRTATRRAKAGRAQPLSAREMVRRGARALAFHQDGVEDFASYNANRQETFLMAATLVLRAAGVIRSVPRERCRDCDTEFMGLRAIRANLSVTSDGRPICHGCDR